MIDLLTTSLIGVMLGMGHATAITPREDADLIVRFIGYCSADNIGTASLRYGTGTAPTSGSALTGTLSGPPADFRGDRAMCALEFKVCSVAPNQRYWLDFAVAAPGGGRARIEARNVLVTEDRVESCRPPIS